MIKNTGFKHASPASFLRRHLQIDRSKLFFLHFDTHLQLFQNVQIAFYGTTVIKSFEIFHQTRERIGGGVLLRTREPFAEKDSSPLKIQMLSGTQLAI
jgi:hypothetical protein